VRGCRDRFVLSGPRESCVAEELEKAVEVGIRVSDEEGKCDRDLLPSSRRIVAEEP
jgi:hypothetical protein